MDTKRIDDIRKIWSTIKRRYLDPAHRLAGKLEECACFFQKKAIEIRKEIREKMKRMQCTLASIQRLRELYPHNVWIEARLEEAKSKLEMYQKLRSTYAYRSKAARWMRVGDQVTKGFSEAVKCRGSRIQPSCLEKIDGTITTCKEEMLEIATSYYTQLLNVCKEDQNYQVAFIEI